MPEAKPVIHPQRDATRRRMPTPITALQNISYQCRTRPGSPDCPAAAACTLAARALVPTTMRVCGGGRAFRSVYAVGSSPVLADQDACRHSEDEEEVEVEPPVVRGKTDTSWPVVVLGLSFHLVFLGFNTVQGFMTTVAAEWGFISLCLVYASLAVGSFVAPVAVRRVGTRRALYLAASAFLTYILAVSFVITPYTLIPASLVLGIAAAVIWTANGVRFPLLLPARDGAGMTYGL